jgi:autotransporter-associated beta strand protein
MNRSLHLSSGRLTRPLGSEWRRRIMVDSLNFSRPTSYLDLLHAKQRRTHVNLTGGELRVRAGTILLNFVTVKPAASARTALINGSITLRADNGFSNSTFTVADGVAATDLQVSGPISELYGAIGLTKNGAGTLELSGTNTYDGDTVINDGALEVTAASSLRFRPTTNGATNKVSGSATGSLSFLGTVDLDLSAADLTIDNSWNLFNLASFASTPDLSATSAVTSTLGAFSEVSPGTWERPAIDTTKKWVFTEADGNLAYVNAATDYEEWETANGVTGTETDDDDNDGLSNFEEYAFGLDPTGGSSVNSITAPLDKTSGTFSYTRRTQSLTGLSYTVWFSTDLATWTQDTGATEGTPTVNGEVETVEVTLSALPGDPLPDKLFIQVRAQ